MPLQEMASVIELIIHYQVEIYKSQPSPMEQTFQFMDCVYHFPTKGAQINVVDHGDHPMESYSYVYPSVMKKSLQIIHVSPSNMISDGGNLMVAATQAMGHYKETFKQRSYIAFNSRDFSIPRHYTKKE